MRTLNTHSLTRRLVPALVAGLTPVALTAAIVRVPVLKQIDLPHHYYVRERYLPQLTTGPSSATWTADGSALIYSMQGSLWRQSLDSQTAEQLTDDPAKCSGYEPRNGQPLLISNPTATYKIRAWSNGGADAN